MFIDGVGFNGYRSFGKAVQRIGPFEKINLFIGRNNSGKSNILQWLKVHFDRTIRTIRDGQRFEYYQYDKNISPENYPLNVEIALRITGPRIDELLKNVPQKKTKHIETCKPLVAKILQSKFFSQDGQTAWFSYSSNNTNGFLNLQTEAIVTPIAASNILTYDDWYLLWNVLTATTGGDLTSNWIPDVLQFLSPFHITYPPIDLIPAIRQIGAPGSDDHDLSGKGIIKQLAQLQNPLLAEKHKKAQFNKINSFLQEVCNNRSAEIEIPHDRQMIVVHMDNRSLPLSFLGTGIHEVIILAAAATVIENQILCIEEPELHIHPALQKKLLRYLNEKTNNQYFITTHSAHLMDTGQTSIFHIRHENGESSVSFSNNSQKKSSVCIDLGYAASDLLQSNCIIWAEGPSDRIYLRHWITTIASDLKEGLHYSIMFYGGRLLSHLTANDPEIDEFISLRRLNRHISIIIDSDKKTKQTEINATKQRVRDEFNQGIGFAWITDGREIENYIPFETLEQAVRKVHPKVLKLKSNSRFAHALHGETENGVFKDVDKVKVAHEVVKQPANLDILDLKAQVTKLVEFIKQANKDAE